VSEALFCAAAQGYRSPPHRSMKAAKNKKFFFMRVLSVRKKTKGYILKYMAK
jgi:hypothetical protein